MGDSETPKSTMRFLFEVVQIVVIAIALSWVLRTYVVEARQIPTPSMVPTIQIGDRVIVDKFYFKYFDHIRSGDIIVFRPPPKANDTRDFIKRVVGLPGDKVEIKSNTTYINDNPLYEPYITHQSNNNFGPVVVPNDSVFVMGDNRNNSDDSRVWGFLPMQNIIARNLVRYWPMDQFGPLAR